MWAMRSARFDATVRQSATMIVLADVLSSGSLVQSGLAVSDGSVTHDRTQIVRRKLQLAIADPTLVPVDITDLLQPYGNEIRVWSGFDYGDGSSELIPVGTFGIRTTAWDDPAGLLTVQASDRMQLVSDERFPVPRTLSGASIINTIAALLAEVIPYAGFTSAAGVVDALLPQYVTDNDRAGTIAALAGILGAEVVSDQLGDFIIQPVPDPDDTPVWTVDAGANGVLVTAAPSVSRENVRNAMMVNGQATGAAPAPSSGLNSAGDPVCADYDPASPTYYYGPFGQVPGFITSSAFTSAAQCQVAGFAALLNYKGAVRSIDFSSLTQPALETGDVVQTVYSDGTREQHILDQLTTPLGAATSMAGSTRAGSASTGQVSVG